MKPDTLAGPNSAPVNAIATPARDPLLVATHSPPPPARVGRRHGARPYLPVPTKFAIAVLIATAWCVIAILLSLRWLDDLSAVVGRPAALFIVAFIAYVPGFMNAFLLATIGMDRRPPRRTDLAYPPITVLVACYNEAPNIEATIRSLAAQDYPGEMEVLIMDDGSTDGSPQVVEQTLRELSLRDGHGIRLIRSRANRGKSAVLNRGLAVSENPIVITVDGDSWVYSDALRRIVQRYLSDPPGTRAVAGCILVRNSRQSWLTRVQEWDYFHGIAAVKRMQSMYHGTLVAQGAFSLYEREALNEVGGWPECVGEDIVVSWALLKQGHRIGYCEDAIVFTNVPSRFSQFARQRRRWARGLLEAFKAHPGLLGKRRMSMLFIWWNILFLPQDLVYTLVFIPGVILALFGHYYIAGLMTLLVLPLALLWNALIFRVQRSMFKRDDLRVRSNASGFLLYTCLYSAILQPVAVWGYASELIGLRKNWGTK